MLFVSKMLRFDLRLLISPALLEFAFLSIEADLIRQEVQYRLEFYPPKSQITRGLRKPDPLKT